MNFNKLAYQLVLKRHARLDRNGKPQRCTPSQLERWGGRRKETEGSDLKIIFNNRLEAEAAAREFEALPDGVPQRAYPCRRSKHGHYHLTRRTS
jgi:hypothetical protein